MVTPCLRTRTAQYTEAENPKQQLQHPPCPRCFVILAFVVLQSPSSSQTTVHSRGCALMGWLMFHRASVVFKALFLGLCRDPNEDSSASVHDMQLFQPRQSHTCLQLSSQDQLILNYQANCLYAGRFRDVDHADNLINASSNMHTHTPSLSLYIYIYLSLSLSPSICLICLSIYVSLSLSHTACSTRAMLRKQCTLSRGHTISSPSWRARNFCLTWRVWAPAGTMGPSSRCWNGAGTVGVQYTYCNCPMKDMTSTTYGPWKETKCLRGEHVHLETSGSSTDTGISGHAMSIPRPQ